jgi:ABC-2 type transport system permease protein
MSDIHTVLRKELLELFGHRQSLRGPLLQALLLLLIVGVTVPALDHSIWGSATAPIVLFALFPAAIASMIAADAFAGERERRTLETLLATPLPERAMFIGKILCAVVFALLVSITSLLSALIVVTIRFGPTPLPLTLLVSTIGGSLAASLFTSATAVVISSRITVARSAQQIASMVSIAFVFGAASLLGPGRTISVALLLQIELAAIVVALTLAMIGTRAFRRDRFNPD